MTNRQAPHRRVAPPIYNGRPAAGAGLGANAPRRPAPAARPARPVARRAVPALQGPAEIWYPVPVRPGPGRSWLASITALLLVMALGLLAVAGAGLALFYQSEAILPGVQVADVSLGGQSRAEAAAALRAYWQEQSIALAAGDATWSVAPEELGIILDAEATALRAYQQGRSLPAVKSVLFSGGFHIAPVWWINPSMAEERLQDLAPQLQVAPINASVRMMNGRIEATPAIAGSALDVAATTTWLARHAAEVVNQERLPLITRQVESAIQDVSGALAEANALLATTLAVHAYDPVANEGVSWSLPPAVWSQWLMVELDPANPSQIDWALDGELVEAYLTKQAATLGGGRYLDAGAAVTAMTEALANRNPEVRLRVYHFQRQHVVQAGETLSSIGQDYGIPYPWIQQANPTLGDSLSVGQLLTIPSSDALLPLPVVENKRIVVSLSQQKVFVYENGNLKWQWLASTGIASSPTAAGVFQVQSHEFNAYASNWDLWMPNFLGIYQPVPTSAFMNGFHGFPTRNGHTLLWTGDLGHTVTYGCILLSSENAATLYDWAEEGVVVEIR